MLKLEFDRKEVEEAVDRIVRKTMKMDMVWDWPCGVAYYGICEVYDLTKNEEYLKLLKDRVDELIELGLPTWTVNTCSMGHCLITLYEATKDQKYMDIIDSKVEYLRTNYVLVTMFFNIQYQLIMISRNRRGQIHCLWQHFSY